METIRKLGACEVWFHKEYLHEGLFATIFASQLDTNGYDLFEHVDLVKQAIRNWMQMHPFLRSVIVERPDLVENKEDDAFFFQHCDEEYLLDNMNKYVSFIKYKNNVSSEVDRELIWKLVVERQNRENKFDLENGPLWKLLFFKFSDDSSRQYCAFMAHHSTNDGKSGYTCLLHLLEHIECLLVGQEPPRDNTFEPFESVEDVFLHANETEDFNKVPMKIPKFLKSQKFDSLDEYETLLSTQSSGIFHDHLDDKTEDDRVVFSLQELIEKSTQDASKQQFFTLDEDKYLALLSKSKQRGVKFTALFNTIFAYALKRVYESKDEQYDASLFKILSAVSLREYITSSGERERYLKMCLMINMLMSYIHADSEENVWRTAKLESDSFHTALKRGEHLKEFVNGDRAADDDLSFHIGNSSFGVRPASLTVQKLLQVRKNFVTSRAPPDSYTTSENYLMFWFMESIEGINELFLCVTFDAKFISCDTMQQFNQQVFNIIDKLIRDE